MVRLFRETKKDGRSRLFCLCDLLGLAYDEAVLYIVHGIDEVGSFAGDAAGTGDHGDYSVVAALVYGFLDDALEHGAHEGFVYEGFAYADLALCVQGSQLGAGAGAAGGTVSLSFAEYNNVALVGAGSYGGAVELYQVNSGDVQTGMLDLEVTVDNFHDLHAQSVEVGNVLSADIYAQLSGIYQSEEAAAEGDIKYDFLAVNGDLLVPLVQEGGNVGQGYVENLAVLNFCYGADNACGSFQNYFGVGLLGFYHAGFNCYGYGTDGAVAAHVEPSAGIDEVYGEIGLGIDGLADEGAEHVVMTAGLKHQSGTIMIVVLLHPVLALDGGVALGYGETIVYYAAEFTASMSIHGLELGFKPVIIDGRVKIHDLLSCLYFICGGIIYDIAKT